MASDRGAVLGYGGLLALMYVFQRALMYFPDTTRTAPGAAGLPQADEVTLRSADGETADRLARAAARGQTGGDLFPGQCRRARICAPTVSPG